MMYGRRKSSPVIVVLTTANKAEVSTSVAESEKRRAGAEGIVRQHTTRRAQYRIGVSHVLSHCGSTSPLFPKVGTVCGKAARTGLCGGREVTRVPTAPKAPAKAGAIRRCKSGPGKAVAGRLEA